jgi:hypothetical protein
MATAKEPEGLGLAFDPYFDHEVGVNASHAAFGGVFSIVGAVLTAHDEPLRRATGIPMLILGSAELVTGLYFAIWARDKRETLEAVLARDPDALAAAERERMPDVVASWPWFSAFEGACTLAGVGLLTAGAIRHDDSELGVGLGMAVPCAVVFVLDRIAARAAGDYFKVLTTLRPTVGVTLLPGGGFQSDVGLTLRF